MLALLCRGKGVTLGEGRGESSPLLMQKTLLVSLLRHSGGRREAQPCSDPQILPGTAPASSGAAGNQPRGIRAVLQTNSFTPKLLTLATGEPWGKADSIHKQPAG